MWFVCLILKQQFYIHINWNYKSSLSTSLKLKLAEASHILIFLNPEFSSLYQIFVKMHCTEEVILSFNNWNSIQVYKHHLFKFELFFLRLQ